MPAWGTLIALTRRGEPIYGMMHQPFTREHFTGDGSARAAIAARPAIASCACAPARDSQDAVLLHHEPAVDDATPTGSAFGRVEQAVRLSRYGGDCYAYCMLAAGHVDLVIETELKPYDVLPLDPDHRRRRRHHHHLG